MRHRLLHLSSWPANSDVGSRQSVPDVFDFVKPSPSRAFSFPQDSFLVIPFLQPPHTAQVVGQARAE